MPKEYRITRDEEGTSPESDDSKFEAHEFLIGIFLPLNRFDSEYGLIVGHSVIWYKHQNKKYVISFTPRAVEKHIGRACRNSFCLVAGEYQDSARVHNDYASPNVHLYKKLYYKVSYLDVQNGEQKINALREAHEEMQRQNRSRYKGFSTALCLNFCCFSGIKYNCTSILIKLLPDLGLTTDLNYPLPILVFNLLMTACTVYFIAVFDEIFVEQKERTDYEIAGVTFATVGLFTNILYILYKISLLLCRSQCDKRLHRISWFRENALVRDYNTQKWVTLLNIIFGLGSLLSIVDCTCPRGDYLRSQYETFEIAVPIAFITFSAFVAKTFCVDCANGCTNPYALRNILDRASIPAIINQQPNPYYRDTQDNNGSGVTTLGATRQENQSSL